MMDMPMTEQVWATLREIPEVVINDTIVEVEKVKDTIDALVIFCLETHDGERHAVAMPGNSTAMFFQNEDSKSDLRRFIGERLDVNHPTHKAFSAKFKAEIFDMMVVSEAWLTGMGAVNPRTVALAPFPSYEEAMQNITQCNRALPRKMSNVRGGPTVH